MDKSDKLERNYYYIGWGVGNAYTAITILWRN